MLPNLSLSATHPKHLYTIRLSDVSVVGALDYCRVVNEGDEEDQVFKADTYMDIQTSTKMQIFYLALISVVFEEGVCKGDRFIKNRKFLPITELKSITASGEFEKQNMMDSLADLLALTYRKLTPIFRFRLKNIENNFMLFWFYRHVFQAALSLLKKYSRNEFSGGIHTKSLLTIIMKQKNPDSLINETKRFC